MYVYMHINMYRCPQKRCQTNCKTGKWWTKQHRSTVQPQPAMGGGGEGGREGGREGRREGGSERERERERNKKKYHPDGTQKTPRPGPWPSFPATQSCCNSWCQPWCSWEDFEWEILVVTACSYHRNIRDLWKWWDNCRKRISSWGEDMWYTLAW